MPVFGVPTWRRTLLAHCPSSISSSIARSRTPEDRQGIPDDRGVATPEIVRFPGTRGSRPPGQEPVRIPHHRVTSAQQPLAQAEGGVLDPVPVLRRYDGQRAGDAGQPRPQHRGQQRGLLGGQDEQAQRGADLAGQLGGVRGHVRHGRRAGVRRPARAARRGRARRRPGRCAVGRGTARRRRAGRPGAAVAAGPAAWPGSPASSGRPCRTPRRPRCGRASWPGPRRARAPSGRRRRAVGRRRRSDRCTTTPATGRRPARSGCGTDAASARSALDSVRARDQVLGEQPGRDPQQLVVRQLGRVDRGRSEAPGLVDPHELEVRAGRGRARTRRAPARPVAAGGRPARLSRRSSSSCWAPGRNRPWSDASRRRSTTATASYRPRAGARSRPRPGPAGSAQAVIGGSAGQLGGPRGQRVVGVGAARGLEGDGHDRVDGGGGDVARPRPVGVAPLVVRRRADRAQLLEVADHVDVRALDPVDPGLGDLLGPVVGVRAAASPAASRGRAARVSWTTSWRTSARYWSEGSPASLSRAFTRRSSVLSAVPIEGLRRLALARRPRRVDAERGAEPLPQLARAARPAAARSPRAPAPAAVRCPTAPARRAAPGPARTTGCTLVGPGVVRLADLPEERPERHLPLVLELLLPLRRRPDGRRRARCRRRAPRRTTGRTAPAAPRRVWRRRGSRG